jgi:aspartokinase
MRNNPIIVQKYGGACLETPAKIRAVASSLADLHSRGHRVVAIVSAMGKTTDELVKMAYQVSPHPNRRELDMLLPVLQIVDLTEAEIRAMQDGQAEDNEDDDLSDCPSTFSAHDDLEEDVIVESGTNELRTSTPATVDGLRLVRDAGV